MTTRGLSRRSFLRACAAGATGTTAATAFSTVSTVIGGALPGCGRRDLDRPNVILILADDLGYECLGCNGGTSYRTPVLDALAATGLRFTNAYCTPLCTPSRVQLMSGQYPHRTGWITNLGELPRPERYVDPKLIDLAVLFKRAGYATAVAGKWQMAYFAQHPDHATRAGFDEHCLWTYDYKGVRESYRRYWRPAIWRNGRLDRDALRDHVYGPDVFADFLVDFVERNRRLPFFAYYPMVLPHRPFLYTPDTKPPAGQEEKAERDPAARFAEMVAYLDQLVGRLVHSLDALGLREQTLVLFTSDNGTPAEITSWMGDVAVPGGKGQLTRAGARVPLIANWPGTTPAGVVSEGLTDSTDFRASFAELTGAGFSQGRRLDGHSLVPTFRGAGDSERTWVYIQMRENRAVRDRRWKLFADGRLFDTLNDPLEQSPIGPGEGGAGVQGARARLEAVLADLG